MPEDPVDHGRLLNERDQTQAADRVVLLSGAHPIGMIRHPACYAGDDGFDVAELGGQDAEELLSRGRVRMPPSIR